MYNITIQDKNKDKDIHNNDIDIDNKDIDNNNDIDKSKKYYDEEAGQFNEFYKLLS